MSALENTGEDERAKRTCKVILKNEKEIGLEAAYLSCDVRNRRQCNSSHAMNPCVAGTRSLGLFVDGTGRCKNVLVGLVHSPTLVWSDNLRFG